MAVNPNEMSFPERNLLLETAIYTIIVTSASILVFFLRQHLKKVARFIINLLLEELRLTNQVNTLKPVTVMTDQQSLKPKLSEEFQGHDMKLIEQITLNIIKKSTKSKTTFDDIVGQEIAKLALRSMVILPSLNPHLFQGLLSPAKGLLLFGPPGNGKTLLAKAVADESDSCFLVITAATLTSKSMGQGEKLVKALFAVAKKYQPSIIFIDEIDSILTTRNDMEHDALRRIKTEFFIEMDGIKNDSSDRIIIIGATNRPHELDDAILRRLSKRIYVGLPNFNDRVTLMKNLMSSQINSLTVNHLKTIAEMTEGYSASDLTALAKEAASFCLRELTEEQLKSIDQRSIREIRLSDFKEALTSIRPSVTPESLQLYFKWNTNFGVIKANNTLSVKTKDNNNNKNNDNDNDNESAKTEAKMIANQNVPRLDLQLVQEVMSTIVKENNVHLDDIIGMELAKGLLLRFLIQPHADPKNVYAVRKRRLKRLLLFGPPGNGKTLLAKAVAEKLQSTFFHINATQLTSQQPIDSDRIIKTMMICARNSQPSVIFLEDIHLLCTDSDVRIMNNLSLELDKLEDSERIIVFGTTSRPQELDEHATRNWPKIFVTPPNQKERFLFLKHLFLSKQTKHNSNLSDDDLEILATKTDSYSRRALRKLVDMTVYLSMRSTTFIRLNKGLNNSRGRTLKNFAGALQTIPPDVNYLEFELMSQWNEIRRSFHPMDWIF